MQKTDVMELKKNYKKDKVSFTRITGCYVDAQKDKKAVFSEKFLTLPEEEIFKYMEIAKKVLSGKAGDTLLTLPFREAENQQFLLGIKGSLLKDDGLLDVFYDRIIETYEYVGNYLILLFHDVYDIPVKTSDKLKTGESEEVYEYILCAVCPVELSKPGLSYQPDVNGIHNRIRDWVVCAPETGFVFPALTDRSTDMDSVVYSVCGKNTHPEFMENLLGCEREFTIAEQKEIFQEAVSTVLGEDTNAEIVTKINTKLAATIQDEDTDPDKTKEEIQTILEDSGLSNKEAANCVNTFVRNAGVDKTINVEHIIDKKKVDFEVVVNVKSKTSAVKTKVIDGKDCLVIELSDSVNINGPIMQKED